MSSCLLDQTEQPSTTKRTSEDSRIAAKRRDPVSREAAAMDIEYWILLALFLLLLAVLTR